MSDKATLVGVLIAVVFFALATGTRSSVLTKHVNPIGAGLFVLTLTLWLIPLLYKL